MSIEFPRRLLRERSHAWNLAGAAATPGTTALSVAPYIRTDGGGYWTCMMSDVSLSGAPGLRGRERQKISTQLWRAVQMVCDGGATAIVVPRNDALVRPWPEGVAQGDPDAIAHSDDSLFSDDSGYYEPTIDIYCDAASLRATSLDITIRNAGELLGGEAFSIQHDSMDWRMYQIGTVEMTSATEATITFRPPLREAVADGTQLEFDRPRCLMRLSQPNAMDLSQVPHTFNSASASFVEAPPPEEAT